MLWAMAAITGVLLAAVIASLAVIVVASIRVEREANRDGCPASPPPDRPGPS